jgi:hypothetical protein
MILLIPELTNKQTNINFRKQTDVPTTYNYANRKMEKHSAQQAYRQISKKEIKTVRQENMLTNRQMEKDLQTEKYRQKEKQTTIQKEIGEKREIFRSTEN